MLRRSTLTCALLLGLAAALTGCSSTRLVDGQVQSFSTLAAMPAPATYRIERLPSQQTPAFDTLAPLAEQSLARPGPQPPHPPPPPHRAPALAANPRVRHTRRAGRAVTGARGPATRRRSAPAAGANRHTGRQRAALRLLARPRFLRLLRPAALGLA